MKFKNKTPCNYILEKEGGMDHPTLCDQDDMYKDVERVI